MKQSQVLVLLILLPLCLLSGCASRVVRAQRHLAKAVELDPTIISKQDVKIDTLLVHDIIVTHDTLVKHDTLIKTKETISSNVVADLIVDNNKTILLSDTNVIVTAQKVDGGYKIEATVKAKTILVHDKVFVHDKIPVRDTIRFTKTIQGKLVHEREYIKGFFYWVGVGFILCTGVGLVILIVLRWTGIIGFIKKKFKWPI